jgi:type 1 fimbria pilin
MFNLKNLLAVSIVSTLAIQANAGAVSSISFTGEITQPTCVANTETPTLKLPTVATTAFTKDGDVRVAGSTPFELKLVQTGANDGAEGQICPTVSYAMDANGKTTPNITMSTTNKLTKDGFLKNTADERKEELQTVAIQITDKDGKALDLSKESAMAAYDTTTGVLSYKARYVALKDTGDVEVQTVAAALNFDVNYR